MEVKRTIGMKHTTDGEDNSNESKRGAYEKIIHYITNIVYICNIKFVTTCMCANKNTKFYKIRIQYTADELCTQVYIRYVA